MTPYFERDGVTIYHGDCRQVLADLQPVLRETADAVVTDPPYNAGLDYGSGSAADRLPEAEYLDWLGVRLHFACALVRPGGALLWSWPGKYVVRGLAPSVLPLGFEFQPPAGWHRREFAGDVFVRGHPALTWEPIIWATATGEPARYYGPRGGHDGRDFVVANSARHDAIPGEHPCAKPLSVLRRAVRWVVPEGGLVVDPFMGTGTTLVAARELRCRAIGIDDQERWCEVAAKRLEQGLLPFGGAPMIAPPAEADDDAKLADETAKEVT